jgi:hypothetical protein
MARARGLGRSRMVTDDPGGTEGFLISVAMVREI